MTDTPETDAFFWRKDIDWDKEVEFCRKLERERNEWKEVAEGSLLGAIHERDEAGELAANLEISLTAAIRSANVRQDELTAVTEQRDRLAEALIKCREDSVCEQVRMEKCRYTKAADESQANIDRADKALQYLNQDQP
jgi:hypothetical protein